ncbi:MAG: hypothetical protein ACK5DD_02565 [Cyclobacteriaceae bacterium]|jgi:hypothetical protein
MKELTIRVKETKADALINFLQSLDFVDVRSGEVTVSDLEKSLRQVKEIRKGKLPKKKIASLLNVR